MRPLTILASLITAIGIAAGVSWLAYHYFLSEELTKAEGRLSLYRSTVTAELDRFSHLTFVLARDPYVMATAAGAPTDPLNRRLETFAARAGLDAIYLIGTDGITIAASNATTADSFVGQAYGFRPYFQDALAGYQGRFYGIGTTTGLPGYFISGPVHDAMGNPIGVVAIKVALADLQDRWREAGEQVFLTNSDGVILLSSDPDWLYQTVHPLTADQRAAIEATRQFPGQDLRPLVWQSRSDQRATINGANRLHLIAQTLPHDWALHYFASDDRAVARSWLVAGVVIIFAGLALITVQVQRTRQMGAALFRSEREEADLRRANEQLAVEIEERRSAERRLQRAQGELDRASQMAALGRLAASVTHELGQPIAAMRNHLAAAEITGQWGPNLSAQVGGLVNRMEGITRQLKFFARTDDADFTDVDLCQAMQAALALVQPNLDHIGATLTLNLPATAPMMRGNQLRLEQVMTNLLRNGLDAMEDAAAPQLIVTIGTTPETVWFKVEDNGHGLGAATLADLREPFVTTRESGRGMGLGLAISSTIINDHGGTLSAHNATPTGAVFHVAFPITPIGE